tara:strand:+ start:94 stop:612 length:519 start_codon:yes stop_codon:yes gene_type:complete
MEDIVVIDDFLSENEMKVLEEYFNGNIWQWGHTSSDPKAPQKWFFASFHDKPYFTQYLRGKIEDAIGVKCDLIRVYANGQTLLNSGSWHFDEDKDGYITALLYISGITQYNVHDIRGHTEFKFENGDIKSIEPIKNRLIIFDSQFLHRGCAPEIPGFLRISVAWKLKKKEYF